jgi:hypothetical protein
VEEAAKIVQEAETAFQASGARAEYCRSHGIDYERFKRSELAVRALDRVFFAEEDDGDAVVVVEAAAIDGDVDMLTLWADGGDSSGEVLMRVRVVGPSFSEREECEGAPVCPLCRSKGHGRVMCPQVPCDLRPFMR